MWIVEAIDPSVEVVEVVGGRPNVVFLTRGDHILQQSAASGTVVHPMLTTSASPPANPNC